MNIIKAIKTMDKNISNPSVGLPEDVFRFVSRVTPMVNVDLLIKDENGRVLLSWRDDSFVGSGWHIPGGIVRYKENLEERLKKVSKLEIGVLVDFNPIPIAVNEIITSHLTTRGHFISFLYKCFLSSDFTPENIGLKNNDNGYLLWHDKCPEDLIKVHEIYRKYI